MTDEVSLVRQSRVWLAPYPFLYIKLRRQTIERMSEGTKQNQRNIIIANNFTSNELDRFSTSDFRWADNRTKQFQHRQVKKGEIYQFEFGKNTFQVFTITTISFSKKRFHWKNSKENDAALEELTSENEKLKKQIAALQEQFSQNNNNQ